MILQFPGIHKNCDENKMRKVETSDPDLVSRRYKMGGKKSKSIFRGKNCSRALSPLFSCRREFAGSLNQPSLPFEHSQIVQNVAHGLYIYLLADLQSS